MVIRPKHKGFNHGLHGWHGWGALEWFRAGRGQTIPSAALIFRAPGTAWSGDDDVFRAASMVRLC